MCCPTPNLPNSAGGGNRCSLRRRFLRLPWCAQGYNERQSKKNAELLRRALFQVAALAQHRRCSSLSRDKRSAALHWRGSSERLRLQGQPLSWLLARSGLSCRPPNPQAVLVPRNLLAGVAAPLLFCAPACASARRFPLWSAKAHLVSPPHRCHLSPRWPYWCLPLLGAPPQKARPPPLRIETVRGLLSGGSAALARTGRRVSHSRIVV